MQHLGGAEPLHDLETRERLPGVEDFRRENLGGRNGRGAGWKGRRWPLRVPWSAPCRASAGRRTRSAGSGRWHSKMAAGLGWPGSSTLEAPAANGKGDRVAEPVGEEDLRHREADVVLVQRPADGGRRTMRVGHVVLQMHDALGPAGGARRVHPERHVVAMRVGRHRAPGAGCESHSAADRAGTAGVDGCAPLTTTRVSSCVSRQAVASNRSAKAASRRQCGRRSRTR